MYKKDILYSLYDMIKRITEREIISGELDDVSLFGSEWSLEPRDIVYLFLFIDEKYDIRFKANQINEIDFFTLNNIAHAIYNHV